MIIKMEEEKHIIKVTHPKVKKFCCIDMAVAIQEKYKFRINDRGWVLIGGISRPLSHCPFCGKEIHIEEFEEKPNMEIGGKNND